MELQLQRLSEEARRMEDLKTESNHLKEMLKTIHDQNEKRLMGKDEELGNCREQIRQMQIALQSLQSM